MQLDRETQAFFAQPVLLMVSAADADRRSAIGRGMGIVFRADDTLDVLVSRWQWPQVVANAAASGRLALTGSRATDYLTYQLKGPAALRDAGDAEHAAIRRYHAALSEELARLHVPPWISGQWSMDRDMVAIELRVAEAYIQTPGPLAGTAL